MMKKLLILISISAIFCIIPVNAQKSGAVKSLLVSYCEKKGGTCQTENVEKLNFANGKLVSRKKIVSFDADKEGFGKRLTGDKLIQTTRGKYFDAINEKYLELPQSQVKESPLDPRYISPNGKVTAIFDNLSRAAKLEIKQADKPSMFIHSSFQATVNPKSSVIPAIPLIWLDNERILTQSSNGVLVVANIDGSVLPFAEIPCEKGDFPFLKITDSGKIIYQCAGEEYLIDAQAKTFKKSLRDLENDFYRDIQNREYVYYFKDEKIGSNGVEYATAENYLAVLVDESRSETIDRNEINKLKVWNNFTKKWENFTFKGWNLDFVGWVE